MEFKTLKVYDKAREAYQIIQESIISKIGDRNARDQLHRASLSIVLNIAEGSDRITDPDKKRFYVISRGSAYECYALIDLVKEKTEIITSILQTLEEISKMLYGLIKKLTKVK